MALKTANCTFPESTYSTANKPSVETLKADIVELEEAVNDHASNALDLTSNQTLTNKTLESPIITSWDGWIKETWTCTYASATSFTVVGDVSGIVSAGMKLKLTNSTTKYFYVSTVTVSTNTTIEVIGESDLTAGTISDVWYSVVELPYGFPNFKNYFVFASAPGTQALADGVESAVVLTGQLIGSGTFSGYGWVVPISGYYSVDIQMTVRESGSSTMEELDLYIALDGVSQLGQYQVSTVRGMGGGSYSVGAVINVNLSNIMAIARGKNLSIRARANTTGSPGISPTIDKATLSAHLLSI